MWMNPLKSDLKYGSRGAQSQYTQWAKAKLSKRPSDSRAVGPLTIPRDKTIYKKATIVLGLLMM